MRSPQQLIFLLRPRAAQKKPLYLLDTSATDGLSWEREICKGATEYLSRIFFGKFRLLLKVSPRGYKFRHTPLMRLRTVAGARGLQLLVLLYYLCEKRAGA